MSRDRRDGRAPVPRIERRCSLLILLSHRVCLRNILWLVVCVIFRQLFLHCEVIRIRLEHPLSFVSDCFPLISVSCTVHMGVICVVLLPSTMYFVRKRSVLWRSEIGNTLVRCAQRYWCISIPSPPIRPRAVSVGVCGPFDGTVLRSHQLESTV